MSLITQCPACATMFRVVPDQLRVSEGWVRCGQCDHIFDANAHMVVHEPQVAAQSNIPAPSVERAFLHAQHPPDPAAEYDWGPLVQTESQPHQALEPNASTGASEDDGGQTAATATEEAPSYRVEDDPVWEQSPAERNPELDGKLPLDSVRMAPVQPDLTDTTTSDEGGEAPGLEAQTPALSFMPLPKTESRPASIPRLVGLSLVCFALAVSMVLQLAYAERNRLSAHYPVLQPALQAMCEPLQCTVSAPRQIDAIAIDSSSFTSIKPGIYALHVTLKNASGLALERPALELTLTDTQDQTLARRVFVAGELAAWPAVIGAQSELAITVPLALRSGVVPVEKVAGYKLLAFYP